MKQTITTLLFLLLLNPLVFGQEPEQDCENALPVCIGVYFQENSYEGEGFVEDEINSATSCMSSGELNDVWYKFSIVTSGDLGFSISPNDLGDDYDWAVYNVTEFRCFDIFDMPSMEVSCNWSGTTGLTGATGPPNTATSQNAGGTNQNAFIPVLAGEQYILNVSNFSSTQSGYTLDLTLSSAQVTGPLQEVDLLNVSAVPGDTIPPLCGSTELVVFFDLMIDCDLIYGEGIVLEDDSGNQYGVTTIESDCESIAGGLYSDWFTLTLDQPLEPGSYQLTVNNDDDMPVLVDICGNKAINEESDTLTAEFVVQDLGDIFNFTAFPVDCQGGSDGNLIVNTTTGTGFDASVFDINWSNGATGSFVSGVPAGFYTVEIGTGSCIVTETLEVTEPDTGMEVSNVESAFSCESTPTGSVTVTVDGGDMPYEYTLDGVIQNDPVFENVAPGEYVGTVEDENGCEIPFEITVEAFALSGTALNAASLEICQGGTATIEANTLEGNNTYAWSGPAGFASTDLSLSLTDTNDAGTYSLSIENENGCTITESIEVSIIECSDTTGTGGTDTTGTGGTDTTGTGGTDTTGTGGIDSTTGWVTGIDPVSLEQVRIYPNPAQNVLNIESRLDFENQRIEVYDIYGKSVISLPLSTSLVLDIQEWNAGMYLIRICGERQQEELVFKVVKE